MRRAIVYSRLICLLWLGAALFSTLSGTFDAGNTDFVAFYNAGRMLASGQGPELYDPAAQASFQHTLPDLADRPATLYLNPPVYALLMVPVSLLPYQTALNLWRLIGIAAAALALCCLGRSLALRSGWRDTLTILLASFPACVAVVVAQNSFLSLALLTAVFILLKRKSDTAAGLLCALGLLKLQLFWLLPVALAAAGRWRAFRGWLAGAVALAGLSWLLCGTEGLRGFLDLPGSQVYALGIRSQAAKMYSVPALAGSLSGQDISPFTAALPAAAAAVLLTLLICRRLRATNAAEEAVVITAVPGALLSGPHIFHYDLLLLVLPYLLVLSWIERGLVGPERASMIGITAAGLFCLLWLGGIAMRPVTVVPALIWLFLLFLQAVMEASGGARSSGSPDGSRRSSDEAEA